MEFSKTLTTTFREEMPDANQRALVNLSWLIKLRWVACLGQLLVISVVMFWLMIPLPFVPLSIVIALTACTNLGLFAWWTSLDESQSAQTNVETRASRVLTGIMLLDLVSLTVLLYWTGGPNNPFALFFFVNLSLAGVVLPRPAAIAFHFCSAVGFGVLLFTHQGLSELDAVGAFQPIFHSGQAELRHVGLFIAFLTCSSVIVYFLTRLTSELRQQEVNLREAQRRQSKSEKYEALGTLAAGAAHELATPLSTIAVVAKEAEAMGQEVDLPEELADDLSLIRGEVDRCRRILDRMAVGAGQVIGESFTKISPKRLIADVLSELGSGCTDQIQVELDEDSQHELIEIPPIAVAQALRGLVKNATDATPSRGPVQVTSRLDQQWVLEIRDQGPGMSRSVLERVSEPFFTTKDPGRGMGLGVFLARSVIERLGGQLTIQSQGGVGTTVIVMLPLCHR